MGYHGLLVSMTLFRLKSLEKQFGEKYILADFVLALGLMDLVTLVEENDAFKTRGMEDLGKKFTRLSSICIVNYNMTRFKDQNALQFLLLCSEKDLIKMRISIEETERTNEVKGAPVLLVGRGHMSRAVNELVKQYVKVFLFTVRLYLILFKSEAKYKLNS
ncbi:hypothetical protein ACJIZ3_000984 [Penstemon smallii]|uniref:Uncharacterized protein n=1 Tax=Penstemon smallii TaxID=265156 RepID=A0ABD3U3T5_9LAMI